MKRPKAIQMNVFAKTLYYEAGSTCSMQEVLYIAWCIRNRVRGRRWFGSTFVEVCLKKWQFSCWNGKNINDVLDIDLNGRFRYGMCLAVAEYVMNEKERFNPIPGVCYYYEPTLCCPSWARKFKRYYTEPKLKHIFFKER